ncbi:Lar family restriction alleviation protein [Enterococcus casseliflavus]|uniref:Lar family restriction alleviation protein n=1 Tax=Enterococcus casseliflavus TaxID=37734 RepID=UPI0022E20F09|nr:Lar family restriction alleviation protein [Enterococcus casseliflavus]
MNELKVKPCPFCGSDDISFSAFSLSPDAYALCGHCNAGIEIQVGWGEMTEKEHDEKCNLELQKVWNRRAVEQPQLNPNQQIVLEWLKEEQTKNPELTIFGTLSVLFDESENRFMSLDVIDALNNLSNPQQEGVFQAFSKWTLGQEEEK